ncbi:MAG: SPASM domain-containing protein [Armatimonadetes bacterium]|nr:SPASM domain-containing protein [Armatimonadota bacterium]
MKPLLWPIHRLREGYAIRDLPELAAARVRGLSAQAWEDILNAQETSRQVEVMRTAPRTLFLEVTGRCPIVCLMCARRYRNWDYGDLDEEVFEQLAAIYQRVGIIVLGGFGEPLVAEKFDDYFSRLAALRAPVALQTSGYRLTEERVQRLFEGRLRHLHISMDSPVEATYASIRPRISFQEVQARIRQLVQLKRDGGTDLPEIRVVFVAMRRNIEELPAMVDLVADMGADILTVQYVCVHSEDIRDESLFFHQEVASRVFDEAEARADEVGVKLELPARFGLPSKETSTKCTDPWKVAYVRWDGEVRPCCYANAFMGNLREQSFWEIWNGPAYRELRRTVNSSDPPDYCLVCTAGRLCGVDDERSHILLTRPD